MYVVLFDTNGAHNRGSLRVDRGGNVEIKFGELGAKGGQVETLFWIIWSHISFVLLLFEFLVSGWDVKLLTVFYLELPPLLSIEAPPFVYFCRLSGEWSELLSLAINVLKPSLINSVLEALTSYRAWASLWHVVEIWRIVSGLKEINWRRAWGERRAGEDLILNYLFSHFIFSILIQLIRKFEILYSTNSTR